MKNTNLKSLIILILCSIFTTVGIAQIQLNVGGGANISKSNVKSVYYVDEDYVTNYFISVRPEFKTSGFFAFSCDIQYSVKGSKFPSTKPELAYKTKLGYVDLIPQVGLSFLPFLEVYAGVGFGFKTYEAKNIGNNGYIKPLVDTYNNDITGVLGARVKLSRFIIHGQFSNSLKNINGLSLTDPSGNKIKYEEYLRNYQIGVAYQIL